MSSASQDDMEYANVTASRRAIIRMRIPIVRGFMARNMEKAVIDVNIISRVRIIYNYEVCTHTLDFKGLCALYTNLYVMSFISRYIDIGRFRLHLRSVSIRRRLQSQNGGGLRSDRQLYVVNIPVGILSRLVRVRHGILWLRRM